MAWEDENTTLMPCEQLHGLVTQSKRGRIHPHLRERDHVDDFLHEEPPSIIGPPVISRARAEGLAVIALATALGLGIAAVLAAPF